MFYRIYNVDTISELIMTATVSRWGNSLAIRIPSAIAEKAKLVEGDAVEVSVSRQGKVVIESVRKEIDFGALYKMITPDNLYEEVSTGAPRGNETVTW
jgi:antitoxin MazE